MIMNALSQMLGMLPGALLVLTAATATAQPTSGSAPAPAGNTRNDPNFYVGMWVTADGYIRHELLPGARYDEARGNRPSAYRGSYKLSGDHIDYQDDTGFTADGKFKGGVLYHGGMVLYREPRK
jgi:hypothetical protein